MATMPNTNINIPYSAFLDPTTGRPSQAWLLWLMSPSFITVNLGSALPVTSGGTGLTTIPANGQLLIGNGSGYTLNTLGHGAGISVTNGSGTITVANTGVLSFSAGTTGLTPAATTTGNVTLAGKLVIANGGTNSVSTPTAGAVPYGTGTAYAFTAAGTTGQLLTSAGAAVPTWSNIADIAVTSLSFGTTGLTPSTATKGAITVAGTLAVANGGTGLTSTPANGALDIGNGTGFTRATLTAGSGVSITNGAGSISISATGTGGDVVGPASATDEAIARYDGTTGKLIQNSSATINDLGQVTLGTGTASGTTLLTVRADAGASVTPSITIDEYGSTLGSLGFRRAGGTIASPTATTATSVISILGTTTGDGTTYANTAAIQSLLETLATPTSQPTAFTFAVTPSGSITRTEVLRLRSTGAVAFSGATNYGTSGQVLQSNGNAAPTWTNTPTLTGTNFSAIPNSALSNSTISGVALGGNLFDLTAGTGVSFSTGTTYNGSAAITITATGSGGTVTSVTGTSPVVSSGGNTPAISLAAAYGDTLNPYASKTANYVLAAPNGSAGVPTFRALVAADVPGSALTKTDDTNVTVTLGGSPTTALLAATSLTLGWSGQLAVGRGGTGLSAGTSGGVPYFSSTSTIASSALLTQYGVVYGGGAGAAPVATAAGTTGQVLTATTGGAPTWANPATSGTVTSVSVVSANGFAGTVATSTTTPAITISTSITGVLKGNGTAISAAVANTDYVPLSTVITKTADYTITGTDTWIINNKPSTALTLTFPAASSWTGRYITVKNMQAFAVNSASSNIVPIDSTTAGTAILLGVVGNWATLVSDGTNWVIMQAASNNNLLLE